MAREAPERIRDLLGYGVPFDKDLEGRLTVGARPRIRRAASCTCAATRPARAIMAALVAAVRKTPRIRVLEGYVAEDLITEGAPRHRRAGARPPPAGSTHIRGARRRARVGRRSGISTP